MKEVDKAKKTTKAVRVLLARETLETFVQDVRELMETMHKIRCREQGEETFTVMEGVSRELLPELLPTEEYRVILEQHTDTGGVRVCHEYGYDRKEKELLP